ncbi:MAG: PKD domain-containing protein, partial [Verrucomicrobiota bacterium]
MGESSTITQEVEIVEPPLYEPFILEPSFEDGMLDGGSGDGRDSWRNSDLGGVIQITSSPVKSGS